MEYKFIVQKGNTSYDGKTFTDGRNLNKKDQLISNTEGPIHLKTLSKILGVNCIEDINEDSDYEDIVIYLKKIHSTSLKIFNMLNNKSIDFKQTSVSVDLKPFSVTDEDKIKNCKSWHINMSSNPLKPLPVSYNDLLHEEEYKNEGSKITNVPALDSLYKYAGNFITVKDETLDLVLKYYNTEGHKKLEGYSVEKLSNIISTSKSVNKPIRERRSYALEIMKAFTELGIDGKIILSFDKTHIAPYIPENIDDLVDGFVIDDTFLDSVFSAHMKTLNNIYSFEKLVNMFENSCVKKMCIKHKSKKPAYYAAEMYVKRFVYLRTRLPI